MGTGQSVTAAQNPRLDLESAASHSEHCQMIFSDDLCICLLLHAADQKPSGGCLCSVWRQRLPRRTD